MKETLHLPLYAKAALVLIGLYTCVSMLSIIQSILMPLIFATIIAAVVTPLVNLLMNKGVGRAVSSFLVLLLSLLIIAGLVFLVVVQINNLGATWPQLVVKFESLILELSRYMAEHLNLSSSEADTWIQRIQTSLLSESRGTIGITIVSLGGFLTTASLTPVYAFMLLYYQPHLLAFIHKLFGVDNNKKVSHILIKTKTLIQRYLLGLSIEFLILAVLNSVGLLLLGIKYAILLGIIGALLNIIPYLGGIIGVSLYIIITLITKSPVFVLYVLVLYSVIQLIDNNYIVPRVVGSQVKLNALVSLIAVIAGAALWGIPGMFLSIPFVAVLKLIFDNIESLEHWGAFLGDPPSDALQLTKPPVPVIQFPAKTPKSP